MFYSLVVSRGRASCRAGPWLMAVNLRCSTSLWPWAAVAPMNALASGRWRGRGTTMERGLSETPASEAPSGRVRVYQGLGSSCTVPSLPSVHVPLLQPSLLPQPWHFTPPPDGHTGQPTALPSPRAPGAADGLRGPPSYSEASRYL